MLRKHFKIALRNLWRHKAFSAINIFGLSIGIATCLVIMLVVQHEFSYDRYNEKANRIVRVVFKASLFGKNINMPQVAAPAAQVLKAEFPEIQEAARLRLGAPPFVTYEGKTYKEAPFAFVDSNFFQVFTISFLKGNPKTALNQPNTIVISQAIAHKYFGKEDPMGKVLTLKRFHASYKVTGVIEKVPSNSHFHFDFFPSLATLSDAKEQYWLNTNYHTYLVLPQDYNYKRLEAKMPRVVDKYMAPQLTKFVGSSMAEFRKKGNDISLWLQPLTDIHLNSAELSEDLEPSGDGRYIYILVAIALFTLLIACINFMESFYRRGFQASHRSGHPQSARLGESRTGPPIPARIPAINNFCFDIGTGIGQRRFTSI